jgi:hypothetical protein
MKKYVKKNVKFCRKIYPNSAEKPTWKHSSSILFIDNFKNQKLIEFSHYQLCLPFIKFELNQKIYSFKLDVF